MIGAERLEDALVAYRESTTTNDAAQMAGVHGDELYDFALKATYYGTEFQGDIYGPPESHGHGLRAGLLASGILIGLTVGRQVR